MLIESIIKNTKTTHAFDFLIICDKAMYKELLTRFERKVFAFPLKFFIVEVAKDAMEASINKLRVFEYPFISKYEKVLFLDCDIIVNMDLCQILTRNLDPSYIYAFKEKNDFNEHLSGFWSLGNYSTSDMEYFKKNWIFPFNAGCFILMNSQSMKEHFSNILNWIRTYRGVYFYEQSFMNVYFNTRNLVRYDVINDSNYVMFPKETKDYPNKIIHFCGFPGNGENKVKIMKKYWCKFIACKQSDAPNVKPSTRKSASTRRNKIL